MWDRAKLGKQAPGSCRHTAAFFSRACARSHRGDPRGGGIFMWDRAKLGKQAPGSCRHTAVFSSRACARSHRGDPRGGGIFMWDRAKLGKQATGSCRHTAAFSSRACARSHRGGARWRDFHVGPGEAREAGDRVLQAHRGVLFPGSRPAPQTGLASAAQSGIGRFRLSFTSSITM